MIFDLPDLNQSLNLPTVISVSIIGLFIGSLIIHRWAVFPSHVLLFLFIGGTTFMAAVTIGRLHSPVYWADAIGELVLWWIYCLAMLVGERLSSRWRRRPTSERPPDLDAGSSTT